MPPSYYSLPAEKLGAGAKIPLLVLGDSGEVFYELALDMAKTIAANNAAGKQTVFIVPVGPVGHYPIFTRLVNRDRIDLHNCWFINMDEYLTDQGQWIDESNPLSFRGYMKKHVYGAIDPQLLMPEEQRLFPDPANLDAIAETIARLGGVDAVYGGVGINGHIAFNEPKPGLTPEQFAALGTRVLAMNPETITANAIGSLNGALDAMPSLAVTVGMKEILSAAKIRLGLFRDWHRAVVRRAAHGNVDASFPVTLLQNHPDVLLVVNDTAAGPAM